MTTRTRPVNSTPAAVRGVSVLLLALLTLALLPMVQAQAADSTTWIQRNLAGLNYLASSGVDGVYGSQTTSAVRSFQHDNGLDEDGTYGPRTELALHNKVIEVQRKVGTTVDGAYGAGTTSAVSNWQYAHSLTNDGITGPATMNAMDIARTVRITAQWKFGQWGWSVSGQFGCLDQLWIHESEWKVYADNPTSDAYGIPQALPGTKMSTAGADWATNPATQIQWGLGYINERYGTPCSAWSFWQSHNWY